MTSPEQQHLDELMDSFNFARVARAMRALQWRWASANDSIPDEPHIRAIVRNYAHQAIQQALTGLHVRFTLAELHIMP